MPAVLLVIGLIGLVAAAIYGSLKTSASDSGAADAAPPDSGGVLATIENLVMPIAPTNPTDPNDPIAIALPIIENFETFSANAYPDPPGSGKYSIGFGHQIQPGESYGPSSTIGRSEAEDLLRVDVGVAWTCVYRNVTASCSPQQYAALISLCFNIGCTNFKGSTVVSDLNNGDPEGAAAAFALWNKEHLNGVLTASVTLTSRRQQEAQLFQSGVVA
jgi:lysozyme